MIVYSALAQSLIEAAATPVGKVAPSLADLVLLINPAIEAARYLPVQALVEEHQHSRDAAQQPPVFVCATAQNDWATKFAFPIGNAFWPYNGRSKNWRERCTIFQTIGHTRWMKTHELSADSVSSFKLEPAVDENPSRNPFWVIQATSDVINGHGGIYGVRFLKFVADLLFAHADHTAIRAPSIESRVRAHALLPPP